MQILINHQNGKQYRLPVSQVVVYTDDGHPVAVSYEHGNLIIHTDRAHPDFDRTVDSLRIESLPEPADA